MSNKIFKRICDCEATAENEQTYFEFIVNSNIEIFGCVPTGYVESLKTMTNEQIDKEVEELDWLLSK